MKISATVITLNEAQNISDCLSSLNWVDEIIVLDSGSTDATEQICRSYRNVRFYKQEWLGYGGQKNKAAELAANDWILNLDADERVTSDLKESILSAEYNHLVAFRMARENYFGKRWIKHCGWYPDYTVRLYNKAHCSFSNRAVHETLEYQGEIATLAGNLQHFTYASISDYLKRMDTYSTLAAMELFKKGARPTFFDIFLRPIFTFVKMYALRGGFLDGYSGLILSCLYACYTFCKYSKTRELFSS